MIPLYPTRCRVLEAAVRGAAMCAHCLGRIERQHRGQYGKEGIALCYVCGGPHRDQRGLAIVYAVVERRSRELR